MEKTSLETSKKDVVVAISKGAISCLPVVGGLVAEVVDQIIPKQRIDRVVDYLGHLEEILLSFKNDLDRVKQHLNDNEGLDLFEEGLSQASRSISGERRKRIANLMAKSLSQKELKYAESKKLLNLLRELTDPELIILVYHSKPSSFSSKYHHKLVEKHPDILRPVSRSMGVPQEEIDRGALQDSYKNTLTRMGLLQQSNQSLSITSLGKLLLRYVETDEENNPATKTS
jgi:hypothetical protein